MPESPGKRLPYRIKSQQRGTHTLQFAEGLQEVERATTPPRQFGHEHRLPAGAAGGGEWTSGGSNPAYLRSAIREANGKLYLGNQGESHEALAERNKVRMFSGETPYMADNRGFVDHTGKFYAYTRPGMKAAEAYARENGLINAEGRRYMGRGENALVSEYLEPRSFAEGEEFVSPSTEVGMGLPKAVSALAGPAVKAWLKTSSEIDQGLGIAAWDRPAISGPWADGAEPSVMTVTTGATMDQLRVAAAMKGAVANQKSVLVVNENPSGKGILYRFHATGDLALINKSLVQDGVAFHTLVPFDGGRGFPRRPINL